MDLGIDLATGVEVVVRAVLVIVAFLVLALVTGQGEHKAMAHMQGRLGPMYAGGYHGWAQLVADALKFVQKEDTVPGAADRAVFKIAPAVSIIPYMLAMTAIPLSATWVAADLDSGVLYVLAVSAVGVIGTLMAGWASANKYALMGALRGAAQLLSYELPMVLAASSVAMAAGTLSLIRIVEQWQPWWLLWQAPAAAIFFLAGMAEIQRTPFDMPIADTELVVGPYTEYGGLRFALFLFTEYAGIVVISAMTTVLFLGGWRGPGPEALGPLWTLLKIAALCFFVIWARVSWPRFREDQLQRLAWGALVPIALIQLVITTALVSIA
jgi:NADH-quinone oxidoreductase subunit H